MADDIVTRLQDTAYETDVCWEAAREIERLRAENKRLDSLLIRQNAVMSNDDIVTTLRSYAADDEIVCDDVLIHDAADEIERLRAQVEHLNAWPVVSRDCSDLNDLRLGYRQAMNIIERNVKETEDLRAAGDALADAMRSNSDAGWDDAIDTWMEARRG